MGFCAWVTGGVVAGTLDLELKGILGAVFLALGSLVSGAPLVVCDVYVTLGSVTCHVSDLVPGGEGTKAQERGFSQLGLRHWDGVRSTEASTDKLPSWGIMGDGRGRRENRRRRRRNARWPIAARGGGGGRAAAANGVLGGGRAQRGAAGRGPEARRRPKMAAAAAAAGAPAVAAAAAGSGAGGAASAAGSGSGSGGGAGGAASAAGSGGSGSGVLIGDRLYSGVLITLENCLLPDDKLRFTPSMSSGLDPDTETGLRVVGCELIQAAGILLRLPQVAMATGQVLFQRFFYTKSFVKHSMEHVSMACVHLASKIEEAPRRIRDVINVFHRLRHLREKKKPVPLLLDQDYVNLKNQIIKAERRVLKELGFCVHVKHPHKIIVMYLQVLECERNQHLVQTSWVASEDSLLKWDNLETIL
ncbi:cyclin-L2-like [Dromiciops gliroides]|uniref:cyclin-L2-like n=1 Tax=Dromiciops gliroides TaxID=33562 RepID=UPI001CC60EBC|nr:cyclin-L2-like [Dromiciops gliroides]